MAIKFTPGPWRVANVDEIYSSACIVSGTYSDRNYMPHPDHEVDGKSVTLPKYHQGIANAHLIAAAPDMYEALKAAVNILDMNIHASGIVYEVMRAAIAKAEGGK